MYLPKPKRKGQDLFVNMVTVGSAIGATIPTTFGQTKCNVLIDTGTMKSCMSQASYQQLMLPATRTIQSCNIKSANGTNLCPIGITECEWMESYWKSSVSLSAKVSCGIIRGSNEGTHDSQQTRDRYPWEKFSCS